MAGKRSATSELNHDNWDQEEDAEEAGTFVKASAEVLEKRVLKSAKRRLTNNNESGKSAFSSLAGVKFSSSINPSVQFNFLSTSNSVPSITTNSNDAQNTHENGNNNEKSKSNQLFSKESTLKKVSEQMPQKDSQKSTVYYSKLKGLNEGVSEWIKKHVDSNPYCILTPIFKDYEKYIKEIESLNTAENKETVDTKGTDKSPEKSEISESKSELSIFSNSTVNLSNAEAWKSEKSIFTNNISSGISVFGSSEQSIKPSETKIFNSDNGKNPFFDKSESTFSENMQTSTKSDPKPLSSIFSSNTINPATFSFGQNSTAAPTAAFSFGSGKPFSFGTNVVSQESEEKQEEDNDEDDEPPKCEFKPVSEAGSIYEKRCKIFVKKDDNFKDRGVGNLFLKPAPNNKMQLIVRAVNSLGNILLNTLLSSSTPVKRIKDNTIMLICLPMPDSEPPPTSVLLRVKTKEDGDSLLEALEKHKK